VKGFRFSQRVTFLRRAPVDDGFQTVLGVPVTLGTVWASRKDVSDGERFRAGEKADEMVARFVVRATAFTRGLTAKDTLRDGSGPDLDIIGIKVIREGSLIEITTAERSDK
jgi:head-tail adaptor